MTETKKFREDPKLKRYEALTVFGQKYREESSLKVTKGVNIIGDIRLSEDETKVLEYNPKMAVLPKYVEEEVDKEIELAGVKVRWDIGGHPEEYKQKGTEEDEVGGVEEERKKENAELEEVEARQVFDPIKKTLNFSKMKKNEREGLESLKKQSKEGDITII